MIARRAGYAEGASRRNSKTKQHQNMKRTRHLLALALGLALTTGCDQKPAPSTEAEPSATAGVADTIYTGGNIITISDAAPSAEALAVKDGKILAVGAKAGASHGKGGFLE